MPQTTPRIIERISIYDKLFLDAAKENLVIKDHLCGIVGYKKVKVPKYLKIKVPVIERYADFEYGTGEPIGWLITFKEINLFKIGTTTIREPIFKKVKKHKVSFSRYNKK